MYSTSRPVIAARLKMTGFTSASLLDCGARLAIELAAPDGLALVMCLLALGERQRHLHSTTLEIEPERHERQALLHRLADQLADLVFVQQQLAAPLRIVVDVAAMRVGIDVHVVEPHVALLDPRERVAEIGAPFPDSL